MRKQEGWLLPVPTGELMVGDLPDLPAGEAAPASILFSLVAPTYKEAKNIARLVELLTDLLDDVLPGAYELIVVDDNSPDETWQIACDLMVDYPQLRVMRRIQERGLATAVIRGWQVARGDILGVIDADLQHPPQTLLELYEAIAAGADLAVASRHVSGGGVSDWHLVRRLLSRGAQGLGLLLLPGVIGCVSDPMSGYFLVRRRCLCDRPLSPLGYKILLEVLGRGEICRTAEVGYVFQERSEGESKVTRKQYIDYIRHLVRLRLTRWPWVMRFLRFGTVGLSGSVLTMTALYLLHEPTMLGLPPILSSIIAYELGIINNFLWNDLWTFRDISRLQKGSGARLKRFLRFNIICSAGLGINVVLLSVLLKVFHFNVYVSQLLAIVVVAFWNFALSSKLGWRAAAAKVPES